MKIAYFAENLVRDQDGVSRVLYHLVDYNQRHGIASFFVAAVGDARCPVPYALTRSWPVPGYPGYRMTTQLPRTLHQRLHAFRPDLVHLHAPFFLGWAATRVARHLGIPCVATYHTDFVRYVRYHGWHWLEPLLRWHNRLVYNACDVTISPSRTVQAALQAAGIRNTVVLPHGVDCRAFSPRFRSAGWRQPFGDGHVVLLCVGRLVWEKNLRLLAQALRTLYAQRTDFAFIFVGDGPVRQVLQAQLPRAYFLGTQTGDALATAYASSDALVFPSATETFGNVTLEAMASGLPCVVANAGGSADVVQPGATGLHFRAASAPDLVRQIQRVLDEPALRRQLGQQALAYARTQDWDVVLSRQQQLYAQAVAQKGRARPPAGL